MVLALRLLQLIEQSRASALSMLAPGFVTFPVFFVQINLKIYNYRPNLVITLHAVIISLLLHAAHFLASSTLDGGLGAGVWVTFISRIFHRNRG